MSELRGTADLEAMYEAWHAGESDARGEPKVVYDPDYPNIALFIEIQHENGEWDTIENDLWKDEVGEWHEKARYERTIEGMWRE